ncbi:MAG: hypothetical protein IPJ65_37055 [Archangiaceae bacterium]|nr:hypothetical protein [Archangiaceae bacterium]
MSLLGAAVALWVASGPPLPEHVYVKTFDRQFTSKYDLALYNGRIWWKALDAKEWAQLPPTGLPVDKSFTTPGEVVEITADGENLLALDPKGRAYYAKLDPLKWTASWGPTWSEGPLYIDQAAGERMAMSHRKMAFEDIDGNPHPVIVGVTTLYILNHGGRRLEYTDPWLPPKQRHFVCLPEHGRFRAAEVSASASTVFVIDEAGHSYTRLGDYDSMGLDPVLRYGWERERRLHWWSDDVYSLPAHEWVQQPDLPGGATTAITILQTGLGNDARELRVASGDGYWKKPIASGQWEKVELDWAGPPPGKSINRNTDTRLPPHVKVLKGTLDGQPVTLDEFAPDCSPASLVVGEARLPLHFLPDWEAGGTRLTGALFAGGSGLKLFHGRPLIEVELQLDGEKVTLVERFRPRALRFELALAP